ncbi:MAG: CoA transferase, partial [Rhodospirillales bacterium]|nr:CoA transferase [Rhodospirillales bacterium]
MTSTGPLDGLLVIDLTRVLAGPYCTMVLADLGARVIKVEVPETGDDSRHFGPFSGGKSAYFMSLNRGKESIALDLKDDAHRATFEALLATADVLVENYRPGAMDRLGYGWEALHGRFPKLIYAACSGFGRTGPYSKRPAYDMVVQAMGGIMSLTGYPDGPPTRVGSSIGDITAGLFTAVGINAALHHRNKTGEGMLVDVGMLDGQVAILENAIARYTATGEIPQPLGARHPSITPFDAFTAADGNIIVAAGNDALFAKLCEVLGRPDLTTNPLFISNALRTDHHAALKDELETELRRRPVSEWLQVLEAAGIPCGPINTVDRVLADPQVLARNMVIQVEDPTAGAVKMSGNPIKLSAFPAPAPPPPAPDHDQKRDRLVR